MELTYDELDLKAKPGAFSTFDMEVHVPEVRKLKKGQVYLEVGVDKGKSLSVARMAAKPGVEVVGVDLRPNPQVPNTIFLNEDSTKFQYSKLVDVIFIDGDHTYEGVKADIKNWYPQMAKKGVMLFHDHDSSSPGVVRAVSEFVESHKVKEYWIDPRERCSMARVKLA